MFIDPSGNFAISILIIGLVVGAVIGGGFEVAKQINANGWSPGDWNWKQIGLSVAGGAVSGLISAIPAGWIGTFLLGGVASLAGGLITGSVNSWETALIAFGIGAIANVGGKALGNLTKHIRTNNAMGKIAQQADDIMAMSAKKKSLAIMQMSGVTDKFMRNAFKNHTTDQVMQLLINSAGNSQMLGKLANSIIYSFISSGTSSALSSWY